MMVTSIFSLSRNIFKKPYLSGPLKPSFVWLRIKELLRKTFKNIVGKRENAGKKPGASRKTRIHCSSACESFTSLLSDDRSQI